MKQKNLWDLLEEKAGLTGGKSIREELTLALDSSTGSALIPQSLEPILVELVKKLSPLTAGMRITQANGKTHEFSQRTALPAAYFEGEKAETPTSNSSYNRDNVQLKIVRAKGGVTGFQQAASKAFTNSYTRELAGAAQSLAYSIEYGILWGNAVADQYQYSGVDKLLTTNRTDVNAVVQLSHLDNMIDAILAAGKPDVSNLVFVVSPKMRSKISTLQTEARIDVEKVTFAGGLQMESYRGVPLLVSSYCRPTSTMGTIVVGNSGTAGSLVGGQTYRWRVAAVTAYGEQWCSAEVTHTVGGPNTSVDITFTAVTGALLYKVYRTLAAGAADSEVYVKSVAARTYDGNGTVTGVITSINDGTADGSVGTDRPLSASGAGDEVIFLIDQDGENSMEIVSLLNEQGEKVDNLIQMLALARTKDAEEFLLTSYQALAYKGDIFNAYSRRLRSA